MPFGYRCYRACPLCLHCHGRTTRGRHKNKMAGHPLVRPKCPLANHYFDAFVRPPTIWWRLHWAWTEAKTEKSKKAIERRLQKILCNARDRPAPVMTRTA